MIDFRKEQIVRLKHVGRHLQGSINDSTPWRWSTKGVCGGIRLETIFLGGQRVTSLEAIDRFIAHVTAAREGKQGEGPPSHSAKQRERSIREAERRLKQAGI